LERRYLNINEFSGYIGISKSTLYVWACQRRVPYDKIKGRLRFDLKQIEGWIKERCIAVLN